MYFEDTPKVMLLTDSGYRYCVPHICPLPPSSETAPTSSAQRGETRDHFREILGLDQTTAFSMLLKCTASCCRYCNDTHEQKEFTVYKVNNGQIFLFRLTFSMYSATLAGVLSYKGEGETNGYLGPNNFIDPSTGFKGPLANLS